MDIDSWPLQNSVTVYGRISNTRRQVQIESNRGDRTGEIGEERVRSSTIQRVRLFFFIIRIQFEKLNISNSGV